MTVKEKTIELLKSEEFENKLHQNGHIKSALNTFINNFKISQNSTETLLKQELEKHFGSLDIESNKHYLSYRINIKTYHLFKEALDSLKD